MKLFLKICLDKFVLKRWISRRSVNTFYPFLKYNFLKVKLILPKSNIDYGSKVMSFDPHDDSFQVTKFHAILWLALIISTSTFLLPEIFAF